MKKTVTVCLAILVLAFAGCATKQVTKSEGSSVVSAVKPIEQPVTKQGKDNENKQPTAKDQTALKAPVSGQATVDLKDIHFAFDQYDIQPQDRQILSGNADILSKNKTVNIVIEGNCDERGTAEYNLALGDRRAKEAMRYLVNLGIDQKRIQTISYGKERPLDPAHNEQAWAKNRRDHFGVNNK